MSAASRPVGTLLSVNVGMPKDVLWQGKTVFTGVFKDPVAGPRRVGRLNVEGDGQGDLGGHGGEQRAVFVYQIDSYRYWERELGRSDFVHGQFGENFTVDGLGDDEVCIGDRYRIGTAVFEVSQPRVTCYRVGIRMNDPRIPALLVSHHRPGFYLRVLEEGDVQAGDEIVELASGPERMTVAEVDALLYLPGHPRQQLLRALRIPALSPGWQASFHALSEGEPGSGNVGLTAASPPPAWPGFRRLTVTAIDRESESAISIRLEDPDGATLPPARPGQYVTVRIQPDPDQRSLLRNYSLSGPITAGLLPDHGQARARRRRERLSPHPPPRRRRARDRRAARHLHPRPEPRARAPDHAGIGATPALAMLHALAEDRSEREIWWLHGARSSRDDCFAAESRALLASLPNARARVFYSRPDPDDVEGRDFDRAGRLTAPLLAELEPPRDGEAYLCGPAAFMEEISAGLAALGLDATRIHTEPFGPEAGLDPRHRVDARADAPPAARRARERPDDRVRAQQPRDPVERRLREPARARRSMRRARPLVVPHGRLPQLRDDAHRRRRRLRPRSGRAPGRRQRAHLLLAAARGRGARPVSSATRTTGGARRPPPRGGRSCR